MTYGAKLLQHALAACLPLTIAGPVHGQPLDRAHTACAGVDRSLTQQRAVELAPLIAKQLKSPSPPVRGTSALESAAHLAVKVLKSLTFQGWNIIIISTNISEDVDLFYRQRPEDGKFVAVYGGWASYDPTDPNGVAKAEHEVTFWLKQEMADIPSHLADCFAWYFVVERRS